MNKTLNIGCLPYDRVRSLQDGQVKIDGYDLKFSDIGVAAYPAACFERGELEIGEVSPVNLAVKLAEGNHAYVGMPVYLSRAFRHNSIYVAANSSIRKPSDLKSARIGMMSWPGTSAIWQRGILQDEYGLDLHNITWVIAAEQPGWPCSAPPKSVSEKFKIDFRGNEKGLAELLKSGDVDAIMTLWPPQGFAQGGEIRRLFEDSHAEEIAYFKKTGHLPIMHIAAVKKAVLDQDPTLGKELFRAFCTARDHAIANIKNTPFQFTTLPWLHHSLEETVAIMGEDYWSYGRGKDDNTMDVFLRYCHEQGVTRRKMSVDELFSYPFE